MKQLTLLLLLVCTGCTDMCESQLLQKIESPNGELKAVSYLYDCGATTGFSTQLSILNIDELIDSPGNVFISKGTNKLLFKWESDTVLEIGSTKGLEIFKRETELDSVSITYK